MTKIQNKNQCKMLITRPLADAEELSQKLVMRNVALIIAPMFEIIFPDAGAEDIRNRLGSRYQALLITSANAVRALTKAVTGRDYRLLTVGDSSAEEAARAGFGDVTSANGDVCDLIDIVVANCNPESGSLLHIAGTVVAGDLHGELTAKGFEVERCVGYEAVAAKEISKDVRKAIASGDIESVIFYSPRTASVFCKLVQEYSMQDCLQNMRALCLSHAVEKSLEVTLWRKIYVAESPNSDSMLALVDRFC